MDFVPSLLQREQRRDLVLQDLQVDRAGVRWHWMRIEEVLLPLLLSLRWVGQIVADLVEWHGRWHLYKVVRLPPRCGCWLVRFGHLLENLHFEYCRSVPGFANYCCWKTDRPSTILHQRKMPVDASSIFCQTSSAASFLR
jgi:hypothetical protein